MSDQKNCLSLCAGIGGLELGLRILWPDLRTVCHVEREAYPASVLCARMADAALDRAIVADDLESFDGRPWRGLVHVIAAGIPCQPFSVAGRRKGKADERWLGDEFLRIVDEVRPRVIVMENVPGFLTGGLDAILGGLESIEAGWSAEWGLFRADRTTDGCPHRRERFFGLFVADSDGARRAKTRRRHPLDARGEPLQRSSKLADSENDHRGRGECDEEAGTGQDGQRGRRPSGGSEELADWPPGPEDLDGWRDYIAAGGAAPSVAGLRRGADGVPEELEFAKDRLRALGNAVIPLATAYAVAKLVERLKQ